MVTCRYRRSAVPEVSPWLDSPSETKVTCHYRRSAVSEVSTGLACLPRDNGDMRRYRRSAVPEVSPWLPSPPETKVTCRYRRSAVSEVSTGLDSPLETKVTCRYRRSAVSEVSTGLACLPRDNGDMRRYRRRAVVEGACRQVTCCNPKFPYNKTESNEMETPPICICKPAVFKWRWRDSNSRPNVELICFLHA